VRLRSIRTILRSTAVCLYVRLTVICVYCDNRKEISTNIFTPCERSFHLDFRHEAWLLGDVHFYLKFRAKLTPWFNNGDFQSIFARSASALYYSRRKEVELRLKGKEVDYELSNEPKLNSVRCLKKNANWSFFPLQVYCRRKSDEKFLCVKTFSGKVVRHSLTYLAVHRWLMEDVFFYP